jgi:hypothetical protein
VDGFIHSPARQENSMRCISRTCAALALSLALVPLGAMAAGAPAK